MDPETNEEKEIAVDAQATPAIVEEGDGEGTILEPAEETMFRTADTVEPTATEDEL